MTTEKISVPFLKYIFFTVSEVKADMKTDHTQQHPDRNRNTEEFSRTGVTSNLTQVFLHGLSRENTTLSPRRMIWHK